MDKNLFGSHIKLAKVYAKVQASVLLPNQHDSITPCVWLGWIVPTSNISLTWALTSSTIKGCILQNLSLKGSSSTTLISCFTRLVHPNYSDSNVKISWYSVSMAWADVQFAPNHFSSPDKSSCWRSISFLYSIYVLVYQIPCISFNFSRVPGITFTGGTLFEATTWVTLTPLPIIISAAVWFLITMATCLLPVVIWV